LGFLLPPEISRQVIRKVVISVETLRLPRYFSDFYDRWRNLVFDIECSKLDGFGRNNNEEIPLSKPQRMVGFVLGISGFLEGPRTFPFSTNFLRKRKKLFSKARRPKPNGF